MKIKVVEGFAFVAAFIFVVTIWALLIQFIGVDSVSKATIIGGVLSMMGGMIGAFGAYFAANNQIKKQFAKQDKDRVLELRIDKINDSLTIINDFLYSVDKSKVEKGPIDIYIKRCFERGFTHLSKGDKLNRGNIDRLLTEDKEMYSRVNSLKKYKIFLPKTINFQEIMDNTSNMIDSNKKYYSRFNNSSSSIDVSVLRKNYHEDVRVCSVSYENLFKTLNETINDLESEIERLLEI